MKRTFTRKLLPLLLAAVMLVAVTVPAFASTGVYPSNKLWAVYPGWGSNGAYSQFIFFDEWVLADSSLTGDLIYSWTWDPAKGVVFGTCDTDAYGVPVNSSFKPVPASELTVSEGLTLDTKFPLHLKDDPYGGYYVTLRPDADGKDYTVSWQGHSITVTSRPWPLDIYRSSAISFDTWRNGYYNHVISFDPIHGTQPYYVASCLTDEADGQHLSGLALTSWDQNQFVELEKVRDGVYRLDIKKDTDLSLYGFQIELMATWTQADGETWSDCWRYTFEAKQAAVASDTPLVAEDAGVGATLPYTQAAGKVTDSITLTVREEREVYLYNLYYTNQGLDEEASWRAIQTRSSWFHTDDEALSLTPAGRDSARFTLSASKPGTYEVYLGWGIWDYDTMRLYHADGTPYTQEEWEEFDKSVWCLVYDDGTMEVQPHNGEDYGQIDRSKFVPFEKMFPGQRYEMDYLGLNDLLGWRLTVNVVEPAPSFTDLTQDWYKEAVNWAAREGIAKGTSKTTFSPDANCTHAHILTFLWRAAGKPESTIELPFTPKNDWAAKALRWAYEKGMIGSGLDEDAPCTAADAVSYIWQAKDKPVANYDRRFTDVDADAEYAQAVAWAVEAGVTKGNSTTTFGPSLICDRGRIATFLFRAYRE